MATKTTPKQQSWLNKNWIISSIGLLIVLLIVGKIAYTQHQKTQAIAKERAAYNQAAMNLEATAAKITAKFGKPDESIKEKSCGYTSQQEVLFAPKGNLYCNVSYYVLYGVENQSSATLLTKQIEDFLGSSNVKYEDQNEAGNDRPPIRIGGPSYKDGDLDCFRSYSYQLNDTLNDYGHTDLKLKTATQGLLLELDCSARQPRAAYYPIKN